MGVIQHHAAVVVVYEHAMVEAEVAVGRVREFADELTRTADADFSRENWRSLIVGPFPTLVNGGATYVCLPDGSKRGWDTAARGDLLRTRFLTELGPYAETAFDASDGDSGVMVTGIAEPV
jgi:hypothetical protein